MTSEYVAWRNLRLRCNNPDNRNYRRYGGRGIRVCAEWDRSFEAFLAHIGPKPSPEHSIDRINNDGHYEPGNVRWALHREQQENKRPCSKSGPRPHVQKTHCVRGHELAGENLAIIQTRKDGPVRVCRACRLLRNRAYEERCKELAHATTP